MSNQRPSMSVIVQTFVLPVVVEKLWPLGYLQDQTALTHKHTQIIKDLLGAELIPRQRVARGSAIPTTEALLGVRPLTPPKPCSAFCQLYRRNIFAFHQTHCLSLTPRSLNHPSRDFSVFLARFFDVIAPISKRNPTQRTRTRTVQFCDITPSLSKCSRGK